jgi:hypothetical protein
MALELTTLETKLLRLWMDGAAQPAEAASAALHLRRLLCDRGVDAYTIEATLSEPRPRPASVYRPAAESPYAATILRFGKFRGKRFDEVDADYLLWILDNFEDLWPATRRAIEMYLNL